MKRIIIAAIMTVFFTSAYSQKPILNPGGSWTFRSGHYTANKFLRHHESTTVYDTTQRPNPRFIIDFYDNIPQTSGKYKVIRGRPMAADQIDIGIGILNGNALTFYSTTGGGGKETITVTVADGKMNISGTGVELTNQKNPKDSGILSFDITLRQ